MENCWNVEAVMVIITGSRLFLGFAIIIAFPDCDRQSGDSK